MTRLFTIAGNKYRMIASIHFNRGKVYIHHVRTQNAYFRGGLEDMNFFTPQLQRSWTHVSALLEIRNERDYDMAVERLNSLIDEVGTDEETSAPFSA